MPIFEVDRGRPVLAQHLTPAAGAFGVESAALVADHLAVLLGEQLMPVASRLPGADSPHLLAVDASGQPVVVEVVHRLDGDALLRALRYGGQASRLSARDLGALYHRGGDQLEADLAEFAAGVPVSARHAADQHAGSRLLLVCAEAEPGVLDAVEFLRQPGWQVDVLQVGVLSGADGRRFVDVSPLMTRQPGAAHAIRASAERVSAWRTDAGPARSADTGPIPVGPPTPFRPWSGAGPDPSPLVVPAVLAVEPEPAAFEWPVGSVPTPARWPVEPVPTLVERVVEPVPTLVERVVEPVPTLVERVVESAGSPISPILQESLAALSPAARARLFPLQGPPNGANSRESIEILPMGEPERRPIEILPMGEPERRPIEILPTGEPERRPIEVPSMGAPPPLVPPERAPMPAWTSPLAQVASRVPTPVTLVWLRQRRNQRFEAKLRLDGVIVTANGAEFTDPTEAAAAASGSLAPRDGWRVWHVGEDGPTLAELAEG